MAAGFHGDAVDMLAAGFGCLRLLRNTQNEIEDYMFLYINREYERLTGMKRSEVLGKRASEIFRKESFHWLSYYISIARSGRTQETTQWIGALHGFYTITVVPLGGDALTVTIRKETGGKAEERSGRAGETGGGEDPVLSVLDTMFCRTHDAMLLVEYKDGQFWNLRNNELHQKLTGFSHIEGTSPAELLGEEIGAKLTGYFERCISTGRPVVYEQTYNFSPGKRVWHTEVSPVFSQGQIRYLLLCSKDITDLKAAQGESEALTRRLRSLFELHSAVMLIIDPASGRIVDANPAAGRFYGYTTQELKSMLLADISGMPAEKIDRRCLEAYANESDFVVCSHRLKSGEIRQVDMYTCTIDDGQDALLYSIIFDVTDREAYRRDLFQEKEVLRTTLRSIGDGVVTTDASGVITGLNTVAQELTGYFGGEAVGRRFDEVFVLCSEETGFAVENPVRRVLETGVVIGLANHTVLVNRWKQTIPVADSAAPIRSEDGRILGVVMVFRDVSGEKEYNRQIHFLSYHDSLTGLFNRRYIEAGMGRLSSPENLPLSVVMGDVNGLKITNDVFGHETGDALLRHMAKTLRASCSAGDVIARWGGDEIVIFMPRTDLEMAEKVIETIKSNIFENSLDGLRLSVSFGCAVKETAEKSLQAVMGEAEEYMYHQKLLDGKSYRNAIINTLLATLYEKSNETEEHSKRMEKHCHAIGRSLQLSSKELDNLSLLALLHDIGKVGVNPNILQKPGPLTAAEWEEMKRHTEIGYRITHATPELAVVADLILSHHERWDGAGYPRGLNMEQIPLACRILAVTDAFDAMTNNRAYRSAMTEREAVNELERNAGTQFDPTVVKLFVETIRRRGKAGNECPGLTESVLY